MGLFFLYGIVDAIVKAVHTDYLKYNKVSREIDTTTFEESSDYHNYKNSFPKDYPQTDKFGVKGEEYVAIEGNHEILASYEGMNNVLLTDESGSVTYEIEVSEAGFYRVLVTYFPYVGEQADAIKGKSSNIERRFLLKDDEDGEFKVPFESADNIVFRRLWGSEGNIIKDIHGNDIRPRQIELPDWNEAYLRDASGHIVEPFEIYFKEGINTFKIESLREPMVIGKIELESIKVLKNYEQMEAYYQEKGYQAASKSLEIYQAEKPVNTTSPTLYPLNDRTSSLTMPNHPSKQILNSIGGNNWRLSGDRITWDFIVPEDGLYEITLRVKQKTAAGMTVARNIFIDNEIPFKEMENYEFVRHGDWRLQTLGTTKKPYQFYFEEGKHTISMEVSLGKYGILISEINNAINNLSEIYREIIIYTGAEPDEFRDYGLTTRIPNLLERFETEKQRLEDTRQALIDISGTKSEKTGILDTVLIQLKDFLKKPSEIHKKLLKFENNIASLGTLIILLDQQPLEIDYFVVASPCAKLMRGRENTFESMWNGIKSFFASFYVNYASVGMTSREKVTTIDVWLSVGQDQANILRRLINETFTPEHNIQVNLKLVSGAALLPATLAGQGPDIALGVGSAVPVDYAMRDAAYDLTLFPDFEEVSTRFSESGLTPFRYLDSIYALPETEMFLVMFYRTDIFEELGFEVPQTWQDVNTLVPDLQNYNLDFYMPLPTSVGVMSLPPNPVFATMFYQRDGDFYLGEGNDYGKESGFASGLGPEVFEEWTRFYTDYSFVLEANFANRFRSGQMPIGLAYYNTYNTLAVFAPEIRGKWDFALVPGTKEGETIRRETVSAASASMMLKHTKHPEEAWKFLKWWTSTETQVRFGREMEGILGAAARYPTANKEAMQQLPWTTKEYSILLEQWQWTKGIPNVPGSYMTGRHLDNALRKVINDRSNPRETIYDYVQIINQELSKKRREFGLE